MLSVSIIEDGTVKDSMELECPECTSRELLFTYEKTQEVNKYIKCLECDAIFNPKDFDLAIFA